MFPGFRERFFSFLSFRVSGAYDDTTISSQSVPSLIKHVANERGKMGGGGKLRDFMGKFLR